MKIQVQTLVFDTDTGWCKPSQKFQDSGSKDVRLSGLNLLLMQALVDAHPDGISTQMIAQHVWKRDFVEADTIAKRVSILRSELAGLCDPSDLIRTLPNRSYQLIGPVQKLPTEAIEKPTIGGDGSQADSPSTQNSNSHFKGTSPWLAVTILVIFGALIYFFYSEANKPVLRDPETGLELVAPD